MKEPKFLLEKYLWISGIEKILIFLMVILRWVIGADLGLIKLGISLLFFLEYFGYFCIFS